MTKDPHYFIGLSIPKDIQDFLFSWRKRSEEVLPFKTWIGNGDYHITLSFLGSTSQQQKDALIEDLMKTADTHSGFDLQLSFLQGFGKPESPRVLWLGVEDSSPLADLQADIASGCQHLGFRLDQRSYRSHITIAKQWRGEAVFPSEIYGNNSIVPKDRLFFHVSHFHLFQIHLDRKPRYEPIHTFELLRRSGM
ncbi:RNA 2',3'-cyclic phosphodiesterase [Priestia abyssalis]|uniref:RNA 2',3'-cyclic phosphodiesterase n=1 Tax=Priestia abyssalis TaxID=1221450 RepID=UPI0014765AF1|nr:RNA 2',3'-cyclic phosphodiesterase [Priestia abyssalis]